jgi:uncharacterized Zn-finger protein
VAGRGGGSPSAAPAPFAARHQQDSERPSGLPAWTLRLLQGRVGRFDDDPEARTFHTAELTKCLARELRATTDNEDNMFIETNPTPIVGSGLSRPPPIATTSIDVGQLLSKLRNDRGVPQIRIGVREFKCIGISPPQDHPHVYINMGQADTILCPYCATRFRFDPRLTASDADPPDSFFADHNAA